MISQAFMFLLAGFETTSRTMSNAFYELALHEDIQNKLRNEIKQVMERDKQFTYENVKSMKYLEKIYKGIS